MRPRTATIQVYKGEVSWWTVEIGSPGASEPTVLVEDASLEDALILAIVQWKEKERLGD